MKETKKPTKVEKATWAALIKKGEAPTVEELTAIFALYTREEVEAAISEYERIKGVKIR